MKPTNEELLKRFSYRRPDAVAFVLHDKIQVLTYALAKELRDIVPEGRNLALALTHLEDVRMRANAGISQDMNRESV